MALWRQALGLPEKEEHRTGLASPDGFLIEAFSGTPSPSGQKVTVQRAIGLSPVWSAVRVIAEQIGQLPLKVYRDVGDGQKVEATGHRSWKILHDKPNEYTPAGRFWSTLTVHMLLWGNAFIRKYRGPDQLVEELYLLPPEQVVVKWDPRSRTKSFIFEPTNGQPKQTLGTEDVCHVFGMSLDGLTGESVIRCKAALGAALARDEFEGGFYKRGATNRTVIEHPGRLGADGVKNLADSFQALYGGSGKAHGTPVLEEGATLQSIQSPLRDLMFVESQQMTRTDIAVMFGLPPSYLGGSTGDSLTYATVEGNQIQFAQNAIAPVTTTISNALTWDPGILPQNIFDCEFVLEAIMRGDHAARASYYSTAIDKKWMLPEEVREKENLPKFTAAQKREANPPPPPQLQLDGMQQPNGNGSTPPAEDNSALARNP